VRRPFYGWVVAGAAFFVLFTAYGAQYSFGVFFSALLGEFGWSRASLSGAFSLYAFGYSAFGLVAGWLTDRWGPRAVVAIGGAFLGVGLAAMSRTSEVWHPYLFYGVIAALGMSTAYVPCNATVARWFVRRRGLAVGLASAGGSLGTFALPPLAHFLVTGIGWRRAYVVFAVGVFAALNALAPLMRRDPESSGLAPDGGPAAPRPAPARDRAGRSAMGRAMRTRSFWMLFATFTATWISVFTPVVHLVPMARGLGIEPLLAATLISALGVAAMAGRFGLGVLSDRVGRPPALAIGLALQVLGFAGFALSESLGGLYLASVLFGFSYGAISALFPAIVTDFFGREDAGALVGLLFALAGSSAALGPVAAGWIFDRHGSYAPAWWGSAALNVAALAFLARARPPAAARD
jgi:MFS family permease